MEHKDHLDIIRDYRDTFEEIEGFKKNPTTDKLLMIIKSLFKAIRADLYNHPFVSTELKAVLLLWMDPHRRLGNKRL